MTKAQLAEASKKINTELLSLSPSTLITLFEIDLSEIAFNQGYSFPASDTIFRFHNNTYLKFDYLYFDGKPYVSAPINGEGFELNVRGVIPTPKLSITVNPEGVSTLALLKTQIRLFDDLIGAKVTRTRTFLKFLDSVNFDVDSPDNEPNPNAYLSKDIYFIDRKSQENKYAIEFELASIWDIESKSLPSRLILATKCPFHYRGLGCLYEYSQGADSIFEDATLPTYAPAVATENNEYIAEILEPTNPNAINTVVFNDKGEYNENLDYQPKDQVYIKRSYYKYYFVAKAFVPKKISPPNLNYWVADNCSKDTVGCNMRHNGNTNFNGALPFGGFLAVNKVGS